MQPTSYPIRRDILKQFWYAFTKTGEVEPVAGIEPDPAVVRSWQRCAPRANPRQSPRQVTMQETSLQTTLKTHADILMQARPFLEDMYQFLEGAYCAIVFADGAGCILDVEGESSIVVRTQEATTTRGRWSDSQRLISGDIASGLGQGTIWAEGHMGTNALGLAMITAMPVQVVGAEHYYEVYHQIASSAAPIHDINGRIIGIIGIIEPVTSVTRHSLSLVMAAARAITNQLQANVYLQEANHRLTEVNTILGVVHEGVIAWDASGRINHVNARAGKLLHLSPHTITGLPLHSVLSLPEAVVVAMAEKREIGDVEAIFDVRGQPVQTLVSLRILSGGNADPTGYIMMLRPMEQVRRLVHQQVGTQASLVLDDISAFATTMRSVVRQARTAARGTAPVLLRGEGGVGKNYMARAIHNEGGRADKPFMAINCRAIPHELMINEFLGNEQDGRPSKFELVDGGTLMLDQIESLSLEMQSALLHVIETGHVMRLGSTRPIPVDVRIVGATAANLERLVAEGNFISHLYYRFGVFNIAIPPLRERSEDISVLADRFLERFAKVSGLVARIEDEAMQILCRYPWPGNIRELESVLERTLHQSEKNVIDVPSLPAIVRQGRVVTSSLPQAQPILSVADAEREAILQAGWATQGQVTKMAKHLGIGRTTLWRKMKRLSISPDDFKT
ncbi:MAG: PTS-dependent dihydroxyacetone kinase operon transcriptional regulator DhaR [Ardenticatenaceae bacterium]|nr:PTS-dependent dihydroxyacetone kinase operon transcriptional regulator DhaR [Ardenticatenaceae bacterium]MCB8989339.1 PTS-dependent dihydroxyacetone kinase operon transcriptional regulator DhaR [Ardenticatenaceae bacterium]